MTAQHEPSSLERVAHALLLARQDIEAVLAAEPAWQAMQHLVRSSDANSVRERELITARLALVPAYRSLKRINEALHGLAVYVAGQSAGRSNSWAGSLSAAMPSLQQAAHEAEAENAASATESERPLSAWLANHESRNDAAGVERPPVDLERLISLIRRGTRDRRPQPLQGMLANVAGPDSPARDAAADDRRLVFPETVPDVDRVGARASDEPVDLVPLREPRDAEAADKREIVVDEVVPSARAPAISVSLDKIEQMEAEIEVLTSGGSGNADAPAVAAAVPLRPIELDAPLPGEEAAVDIVRAGSPQTDRPTSDDGEISATTGVRRFMSAWNDRLKR